MKLKRLIMGVLVLLAGQNVLAQNQQKYRLRHPNHPIKNCKWLKINM
jgi:hypothetical protein